METLERRALRLDQLDQAPIGAGLYAWYAVPVGAIGDWEADVDDQGVDHGRKRFVEFLAKHTRRLRHPEVRVDVNWHLWAAWKGRLDETGVEHLASAIEVLSDAATPKEAKKLHAVIGTASRRSVLADVLMHASPQLCAPIYIGVTKHLRERLNEHADDFDDAFSLLQAQGDPSTLPNKFGARAAKAGFTPEVLRVSLLEIGELDELTDDEVRDVAEAAEFVLNRWFHPIFGVH